MRWEEEFTNWVRGQMMDEGIRWDGELAFEKVVWWLGRKIRWGGVESNKMCWVFYTFWGHQKETGII